MNATNTMSGSTQLISASTAHRRRPPTHQGRTEPIYHQPKACNRSRDAQTTANRNMAITTATATAKTGSRPSTEPAPHRHISHSRRECNSLETISLAHQPPLSIAANSRNTRSACASSAGCTLAPTLSFLIYSFISSAASHDNNSASTAAREQRTQQMPLRVAWLLHLPVDPL